MDNINLISQGSLEFEAWWKETYEGKFGTVPIMELTFKEVALAAWNQASIDLCKKLLEDYKDESNFS
jgi:hypothetical protein